MVDYSEDLEQEIYNEAEETLAETMWGKYANDIINGINNNSSVLPNRAIWELVQNARDVSKSTELATIKFIRKKDEFIFEHNGQPFDRKSIQALIIQTSSKVRNDIVKIGQYGTGFLTTHKFGLRFKLSGSLKVVASKELYYNIGEKDDFIIDRSSCDKGKLSAKIQDQIDVEQSWGKNMSELTQAPTPFTRFTYLHDHEIERINVKEAFEKSPVLTPYVLALNPLISKIVFIDEEEQLVESYSFKGKRLLWENEKIRVEEVSIFHNNTTICLCTISSVEELDIETNESKVTIVLPCKAENCSEVKYHQLEANTPQLYLYLPLLGTENWGWNYIIHAPSFTCDKDTRDSLLFIGNGQNNDYQANQNRELINLAGELIKEYISTCIDQISDRKYLCRVNFLPAPKECLTEYYESLQNKWVSYFELLPLVKSEDDYITVDKIKVLDEKLLEACTKDIKLLDSIYTLLSKEDIKIVIPEKSDLLHWSCYINEWYVGRKNPHSISINDVCTYIKAITLNESDLIWLHKICEYLKDNPDANLPLQGIVPNENLKLISEDLVKPVDFNKTFRSILKTLLPSEVEKFIHPRFIDILVDNKEYDKESAKKSLTNFITELPSYYAQLKSDILENKTIIKDNYPTISKEIWQALLDMYRMLLPIDGVGFSTKIYKLITEFYQYEPQTNDRLTKEWFDIRNCYTILINDSLLRFTLLDDKSQKQEWGLKMVNELFAFQDTQSILRNYTLYPDQNGIYKYSSQLKKEIKIPSRLKEIYKEICNKDVQSDLVDTVFQDCFIETGSISGNDLANEIQKPFTENNIRSLEGNKYQKLFIEIIQKFSDPKDGITWQELFSTINAYKSQLMLSVIDSPEKRESIFQIMKVQDVDRLSAIAELSKFDNFERVIELGKLAIEKEIQEKNDFEFKKQLGQYVENYVLHELNEVLHDNDLKISVIDEQGGQDLKVMLNGDTIYYIEVKSRWHTDRSVMMSMKQHQTSYKEKHRYALCAVDMCNYNREFAKDYVYPEIDTIKENIRFITNIGKLNERMKDSVEESKDIVHIASGYQVLVPQDVINRGISFDDFISTLKNTIENHLR